jgi:hypothetical protein
MPLPKVKTVNVVTMIKGQQFAERLFDGADVGEACDETHILKWPGDDTEDDPPDALTEAFHDITRDICHRVYEATRDQIAEAFVRIANAAIEEERTRDDSQLSPPRIETVPVVTEEHAEILIDVVHDRLIASGGFSEALGETEIMIWPESDEAAQAHHNDMGDEIRDRLFAEIRHLMAEAFVRIANDVTSRERRRR